MFELEVNESRASIHVRGMIGSSYYVFNNKLTEAEMVSLKQAIIELIRMYGAYTP
jgi:hypothetical protein